MLSYVSSDSLDELLSQALNEIADMVIIIGKRIFFIMAFFKFLFFLFVIFIAEETFLYCHVKDILTN